MWEPTSQNKATVICKRTEKTWNAQLQKKSPSQESLASVILNDKISNDVIYEQKGSSDSVKVLLGL